MVVIDKFKVNRRAIIKGRLNGVIPLVVDKASVALSSRMFQLRSISTNALFLYPDVMKLFWYYLGVHLTSDILVDGGWDAFDNNGKLLVNGKCE